MKPPAKLSPAPVGSCGSSSGNAGTQKTPRLSTIIAPYSPRFTTSVAGPILKMCLAARNKLCSFESSRVSESLIIRMSTWLSVRTLDPVVHGIQRGDFRALLDLMKHVPLQIWRDVGKENVFRAAIFFRQAWLELSEHVQLRRQRYALVQVLRIAAGPEKCLAIGAFQSVDIAGAPVKNPAIHFREVVTHDPNQVYVRKETRRHREISGRSTKRPLHLSIRAFQSVERDGTHNE